MVELIRTSDPVLLSWLRAALAGDRIEAIVLDVHTSMIEGSISAIQPRLMVAEADLPRARDIVLEAERLGRGEALPE